MNSVKLNKKHLFSFIITLVLLFSLNLNTFASTGYVFHFADQSFKAFYADGGTPTYISGVTANSYDGYTQYVFPQAYNTYTKGLVTGSPDLDLYVDTQYKYSVDTFCMSNYSFRLDLTYFDTQYNIVQSETLVDGNYSMGRNTHTGSVFIDPVDTVVGYAFLITYVASNDTTINGFRLYDMTFSPTGPLYGESISTPDLDDFEDVLIGRYDDVMGALPKVDKEQFDSLFNFDFDSFTAGMSFVRDMFDMTMSTFGFTSVLAFALAIGLATYVIGRKVR